MNLSVSTQRKRRKSIQDIQMILSRKLGGRVNPKVWEELIRRGAPAEVLRGLMDDDSLVIEARDIAKKKRVEVTASPSNERKQRRVVNSDATRAGLHVLLKNRAARGEWPSEEVPPEVKNEIDWDFNDTIPALSRITLTVDLFSSPAEVGALYAKYRAKHLKSFPHLLSTERVKLAVFYDHHVEVEPRERMAAWNRANPPELRYSELKRFNKEAREAVNRLLHGVDLNPAPPDGRSVLSVMLRPDANVPKVGDELRLQRGDKMHDLRVTAVVKQSNGWFRVTATRQVM